MSDLINRERLGTTLPKPLMEQLRKYSETSMIAMTRIIETALTEYLENHKPT